MITFAICDDEPLMARELAGHLAGYMKEKSMTDYSVSSFSNGCALLERVDSFDVIFLDIQMEQPNGMETARLLRQRGVHSLLIFVTVLKDCGMGPAIMWTTTLCPSISAVCEIRSRKRQILRNIC